MDNTKLFNTFTSNLQKTMSSDIFGAKTQYQEKNGLAQKIAYAQWINDYASEIYYTAEDPRERANAKLIADSIHEQMPGVSEKYIIDNYENIIHRATGNKLNATGLMDVFGQKIAEGYKSFWAGVNAIAYTIEDSFKEYSESDEQKRLRQERQNAYLSSISGKVRTDYYNEYDNFVQKAILGLGDTLPSLLNSAPAFIGAAATSATGVPLFYAVGKGVSDTLNFTMEFGSLVQTLRETNATPEQILSASLLYAGISTAIEHNFDKIPENLLARPAGEFLQLYHAQKGLGVKAVTDATRKVYGSVGKAVAGQFIKAGTDWVSETGEEVLQQLAEDLTVNLLSDYREQHGQEALPDYVTHTPKEIGDDLVETFKQMGTTQTLISTLSALGGLGFDASFGSIRQLVNSNKYTSKTQNSYMKLSSDVMGVKSDMNADKDNPFTPVRGKQTSIGYLPADLNNARKAGAIRQADTDKKGNLGRLSAMQVEDSDDFVEKDKADKNKAVDAVSDMPDKNPIRIAVADDGTIIVPKNKIGGIVRDFIVRNYDKYNGIRETSNGDIQSFDVTVGDTTYSFTSDSNIEAESVTDKMTLQRMLSQKGDKISYINDNFRKNLTSLFEKRGLKGDELNKTVNDFNELAQNLHPTAQTLAQDISNKKNVDPDLAEQIAYGISGMVAEFKTIADIDSEWAKNHVVLADKLIDSENKTVGGKSIWTVGDQKYKNYLDIPVNQRKDVTFNISVSDMVNQTTGIHEIGHMALSLGEEKFIADDWFRKAFRNELMEDNKLKDENGNVIKDENGNVQYKPENEWTIGDDTHEAFASKLETYIDTGVADSKEQANLFRRILRAAKAFFDKIYNSLTKDQLEFYDRLFDVTRDENVEISTDSAENSQNMAENAENQEHISESEDDMDIEDYYEENPNYGFDDADVPDYDEYGDYYRYQRLNTQVTPEAQKQYDDVVNRYKDTDQWLKAPNGKDSNLDERSWVLVRTDNFKDWFGDWENDPENASKIVDENGEPLVVYHGTERTFDYFDGSINLNSSEGAGNYYTPDFKLASGYGNTIGGFLRLNNPVYAFSVIENSKTKVENVLELLEIQGYRFYPQVGEVIELYSNSTEVSEILDGLAYVLDNYVDTDFNTFDKFRFYEDVRKAEIAIYDVDGYVTNNYYYNGNGYSPTYVSFIAAQFKSLDNNGDFSMEDDRFRYQKIIDRKDFQEFELESVNQRLEQGKMIPSPQLTRYKDKSDWARAEQRAETIYNDGELVWMSELLKSIVQEVKGDLVLYDQISDSDWALIEKAFVKRGDEKVGSMYRTLRDKAYSAYREDGKIAEKTTDFFNGNDVDKVLKRLYVNNLFYSQDDQVNAWLNKFTGKDADAGKRNAKWLAMKLRDLGIFDRDKVTIDGLNVSQRFRFLDTLLQTMYTGPEDRHYDYTRAGRAVWMGAQQEILKNAAYLMAIDQNYTERAEGGVRKSGVEDTGVALKYQSFAEKDIRKSYEDKVNAENELAQKQEELANALAYADDIRKERDDTVAELKKVAEKYNIDTEGMYRVEQVADAIRKADEKVAKENEKLLKKADDIKAKLDESRDNIRELRSDIRIKDRSHRELEVQNRKQARDIQRLSSDVKELLKTKDFDKVFYNAEKNKVKQLEKELDDTITRLDSLRKEDNELKKNYDSAIDDLRDARKKLLDAEKTAKENTKLKKQAELDNEAIRIRDNKLSLLMGELREAVKRKEKYARALWIRNEQIEDMKVRRLIEHSKRNWKELLERKSGDATTDKALRMISRAFFQRHSTNMVNQKNAHPFKVLDIKGNPDLYNAINKDGVLYDSNNVGRTVKNLYSILEREGLIVDGKLVKGFSDLNLSAYKEVADAIRVARNQSNSASNERTEQRKNLVRNLSAEVAGQIDQLGLSKADRDEARKRFLNGEFETEQMAMLKVWEEKKPYLHEGTQAQKKRKKSINYGKTFNANNNIAFNSFTSGYNLLGEISPKLQELFFFGSDDMEGINKVTDNYLKRVAERKQIVEDAVTKFYNGDKKAVQKFMKDSQKTFVTEQYDGSPAWLADSQTWNNFRNTQEYKDGFSDDSLTLAEIIGIYEHSKQEEDLAHILQERTNITARQIAYIVNEFEKDGGKFHQYKEVADAYQHAYEKAWDRFQKVANDVYDMALTHYDFYSPARTSENETDIGLYYDFDAQGNPNTYGKKMTMAERADMQMKTGGNNPITLDYITGFNNIIRSQEWFINAAEFFKNWNDIMKNDGGGVRRMIDDRIGSGASDTVMKWMRSVANSEFDDIASGLNKYMDAIRNHMALANLGFSVSSTFQQPSVMFLAASKYGYRKMFSALSKIKSQGGLKAFREYVHGKSLQIKSSADANIAYAKQAISDSKFLKAVGIAQDIAEIGMRGIEYTDQICRCITWEMGYEYYLEKDYSEDEASMRATQDTMNMNSSRQAKDNSLVYNSKNPLWKGLLMFTNQLNKQWNMLIGEDGVKALFNGNVKRFVSTVMGLGLATTWVLLAKGKLFNSDDDEKWWEDLWVDYLGEGISVVPVIGDKISSVINGYSYLDSDLVTSMSNFIRQVAAEDKGKKGQKVTTATKNMLVDFTELIGAPKVVFKNTYNALFENGKWVGDEYFTSGRYLRQLLPYEWYQFVTGDK